MIATEMTPRTELQQLMDEYCDYHKDVYGVKARWIYNSGVTVAELKKMLASLELQYHEQAESERKHTERSEKAARELIRTFMTLGAKDVAMAIRWIHESQETYGDNRFLDFELCCSYGFIDSILKNGL